jgi:hypothetical protein
MHHDENPLIQPQIASTSGLDRLHVCAYCSHELVYPLNWAEEGPSHWRMVLRCPDCEATREGLFKQQAVDLFADELDRGEAVLLCSLKQITRTNMAEEIDFFIRALRADLIVPSDFQR